MSAKLQKLENDMEEKLAIWKAYIALDKANPFWKLNAQGGWNPSGMYVGQVAYTYTKIETALRVRDYCNQFGKERDKACKAYAKARDKYLAALEKAA